jgi:dephospho-CoA kinase
VLLVGLTGGIGAGKSTVARHLARLGAVVIDADVVAREVLEPGSDGLAAVVAAFGPDIVDDQGRLNRPVLGRIVFDSPDLRATLNALVHPRVAARTAELIRAAAPAAIVVHDVPLLVENRMGPRYHLVLVVAVPEEERVRRLVTERGMTGADAWARVRSQASDAQRRAAADVWLENTGDRDDLLAAIDRLWAERIGPYADNLLAHRVVSRPERLQLSPPDPSWQAQGERLTARVAHAAGGLGRGVAHVGSTAVPGLPAKDVIDLQLGVATLDDADAAAPALAAAGFPRAEGEWFDNPKAPDLEPARWVKRFHGSADPGRVVHLHVRVVGSPGWHYALLFRDWLRADAAALQAYAAHKRQLAAYGMNATAYAAAKEPWFDLVLTQARAWADRTGWRPPDEDVTVVAARQ